MKIKMSSFRRDVNRPQEEVEFFRNDPRKTGSALMSLLKYELGFGGIPVTITETRLVVQTRVMSKLDRIVWEGESKDMEPLLQAVRLYLLFSGRTREEYEARIGQLFDDLEGTKVGEMLTRPLYLTTVGPLLMASGPTRATAIALLAETEEHVELLRDASWEEFELMFEAKFDEGLPTTEVLQFITA